MEVHEIRWKCIYVRKELNLFVPGVYLGLISPSGLSTSNRLVFLGQWAGIQDSFSHSGL